MPPPFDIYNIHLERKDWPNAPTMNLTCSFLSVALNRKVRNKTRTLRAFHSHHKHPIHYLRYADDILFGIPLVTEETDPLKLKDNLRTIVYNELQPFALKYSWMEYLRPKLIQAQSQLEVLGLLVFLSPTGRIRVTISMEKWGQRLTCHKVRAQMKASGLPLRA